MVQPIVRNLTSSHTFCLKSASNAGSVEDDVPSKSAIDLTLSLSFFPIRDPRWLREDFALHLRRDWLLPFAGS